MLPCDHRKFENSIDPLLGYPPAFASLCSHSLFSLSSSFLPYQLSPKQIATCKGLDALFPAITQSIENAETMASLRRNQGGFLWAQLNHLGNAGFDPAEFRIDPFGNVLQWAAPPFSPLAWDVDHWFPLSRGGKTVGRNLRLIQWQVREQKGQRLEFLMPWWDFQLGISVNQFLLIYASKNADFRNRAFSWLYGSDHHHEIKHSWPAHFKRRAEQHGYAAAGIVNLSEIQNKLQPDSNDWPCEVNNNREDGERKAMILNANEVQQKQEEVSMIEKELKIIKDRNERESVALEELENTLARHKKQLEKQRMWSETQSHYRQCLERVIRDTLHQNIIYREQARLNQAACGALLAKIQSHKVNAEDVEINLIKQLKHREALEVLAAQPDSEFSAHTNLLVDQDGFGTGLRSLTDPPNMDTDKILGVDNAGDGKGEEKRSTDVLVKRSSDINSSDASSKPPMDTIMEEEDSIEEAKVGGESQSVSPLKRKVVSDPDVRHGFQRQRIESNGLIYGRDESLNDVKVSHVKVRRQGQQLEDVLQEALTLKSSQQLHDADGYGDTSGFFVSGNGTSGLETEEQRTNRLGKSNVEKWLHRLLLNTNASDQPSSHDNHDERRLSDAAASVGLKKDRYLDVKKHEDGDSMRNELEKPRKVLDGLFRMVSFRHDHARKLKTSKDRTKSGQDDNVMRDGGSHNEAEEIHCMQENVEVLNDSSEVSNDSICDVVPSDIDFVKKMKDLREVEKKKRRSCLSSQQSRPLHWHHQENKDDDAEGLRAFTAIENLNPTNTKSFLSESKRGACQDQLKRSLSMRALTTTSGERCNDMAMHTRRGSDMLTSSWLSSSILEEDDDHDHDHDHDPMESILQPSWSMRGEKDDGHNKSTSGGLKASLRTCTKAVKHAVSKRRSNKL